jgi:hypothetical protein
VNGSGSLPALGVAGFVSSILLFGIIFAKRV